METSHDSIEKTGREQRPVSVRAADSIRPRAPSAISTAPRIGLVLAMLAGSGFLACAKPSLAPPAVVRARAQGRPAPVEAGAGRVFRPPVVGAIDKPDRVRVRFEGNRALSSAELLEAVYVDQADDFAPPVPPLEEIAEIDQYRVMSAYFDLGYVHAHMDGEPRVERKSGAPTVVFRVVEGERYVFGAIRLRELDALGKEVKPLRPKDTLMRLVSVSPGSVFVRSELASSVGRVRRVYADEGYADAYVSPETETDDDAHTVDVSLTIHRGSIAHVEDIEIVGASDVDPAWVVSAIGIRPGDRYCEAKLETAKEVLTRSGRFRSVDVSYSKTARGDVRLVFEMKP